MDIGEAVETAVKRELIEEAGVELFELKQFGVYSDPSRDPRFHTVSVVFSATAKKEPVAGDDAKKVGLFSKEEIFSMITDKKICFDHGDILKDYFLSR